jgi:hypothetical protein
MKHKSSARRSLVLLTVGTGMVLLTSCSTTNVPIQKLVTPSATTSSAVTPAPTTPAPELTTKSTSGTLVIPPEVSGEVTRTELRGQGSRSTINPGAKAGRKYDIQMACEAVDPTATVDIKILEKVRSASSSEEAAAPGLTTLRVTCDGTAPRGEIKLPPGMPIQINFVKPVGITMAYAIIIPQ